MKYQNLTSQFSTAYLEYVDDPSMNEDNSQVIDFHYPFDETISITVSLLLSFISIYFLASYIFVVIWLSVLEIVSHCVNFSTDHKKVDRLLDVG